MIITFKYIRVQSWPAIMNGWRHRMMTSVYAFVEWFYIKVNGVTNLYCDECMYITRWISYMSDAIDWLWISTTFSWSNFCQTGPERICPVHCSSFSVLLLKYFSTLSTKTLHKFRVSLTFLLSHKIATFSIHFENTFTLLQYIKLRSCLYQKV